MSLFQSAKQFSHGGGCHRRGTGLKRLKFLKKALYDRRLEPGTWGNLCYTLCDASGRLYQSGSAMLRYYW
jgi:hypothetical protein